MTWLVVKCPECDGEALRYYVDGLYRCRECGHRFGPYLEPKDPDGAEA